jgi:Flp pilus assembly protein TadG
MSIARNAFARSSSRLRLLAASFTACQSGMAAIEFGIVAVPLIAAVIAAIQIGVVSLAQVELETAVEKAARGLLTGQVQQSSLTQTQFASLVCANLPALFSCSGLMVDLQQASSFASATTTAPKLTYDSTGKVTNSWQFQMGGADTIMVLRVFYQFPVIPGPLSFNLGNLPNGKRLLMSTSVFQVEPYALQGP